MHAERYSCMSQNFVLLDTNYSWCNWGPLHGFTLSEPIVACQGKMVFRLAPPACMLQALLSQIKAVGPSKSGGKAQIMGQKRKSEKSFGFCDHQMTSTTTKDD